MDDFLVGKTRRDISELCGRTKIRILSWREAATPITQGEIERLVRVI
jgi:hypothetical protein